MKTKYICALLLPFAFGFLSCDSPTEILNESVEEKKSMIENLNLRGYLKDEMARTNSPLRAFTFTQETVRFSEGEPQDTSIWYEAIQYPDLFRMDFGEPEFGNTNLYRNDSLYAIRQKEVRDVSYHPQEFLLLEGGLYHYPLDTTINRLSEFGIDTSIFHSKIWEGKEMYVIGALEWKEEKPQIWIEKERGIILRRKTLQLDGNIYKVVYYNHKKFDGHWIETGVDFYMQDSVLLQKEKYLEVKAREFIDPAIFDPSQCMENHWLE